MKPWSHWVYCAQADAYDKQYAVKAVKTTGVWRCAERNLAYLRYGQMLTQVRVAKRRGSELFTK